MLTLDAAVRYSLAASLAYQPPAQLLAPSESLYMQRLAPFYRFSHQVNVDSLCASATIFERVDADGVVVAFRGSTAIRSARARGETPTHAPS